MEGDGGFGALDPWSGRNFLFDFLGMLSLGSGFDSFSPFHRPIIWRHRTVLRYDVFLESFHCDLRYLGLSGVCVFSFFSLLARFLNVGTTGASIFLDSYSFFEIPATVSGTVIRDKAMITWLGH